MASAHGAGLMLLPVLLGSSTCKHDSMSSYRSAKDLSRLGPHRITKSLDYELDTVTSDGVSRASKSAYVGAFAPFTEFAPFTGSGAKLASGLHSRDDGLGSPMSPIQSNRCRNLQKS
jgi:hypothetical protein